MVNPYNVPWDELNADPLLKEVKIMKKKKDSRRSCVVSLKGDENMIRDVMWALKHNSSADRGSAIPSRHRRDLRYGIWFPTMESIMRKMENAIRTGRIIIIAGTVVQKDRAEKRTLSDCGKTR